MDDTDATQKEVIISIQGRQQIPFMENEMVNTVEMVTDGCMYAEQGNYFIIYNEDLPTRGPETVLMVEPSRVTLTRAGGIASHMVFERGRKHLSYFDTQDTALTVGVSAQYVTAELSEQGGHIEVEYALEIGQAITSRNNLTIDVRRV